MSTALEYNDNRCVRRVILFGAGESLGRVLLTAEKYSDFQVIEIWDNDPQKYGKTYAFRSENIAVAKPHRINEEIIIVITAGTAYETEIRQQLLSMGIADKNIKDWFFCFDNLRTQILDKYKDCNADNIQHECCHIRENGLHIFNNGVREKYRGRENDFIIYKDEDVGLLYSFWQGKRIYLRRGMNRIVAKHYLNNIRCEQDIDSPHCYRQFDVHTTDGDVIVDAGAAEGFFALERVDNAKKIYIIENNPDWLAALQATFAPYADKVTIIPKRLSDTDNDECVSIDNIAQKANVSYIKMNIEGEEIAAVKGANKTLSKCRSIKLLLATYHRHNDADVLSKMLLELGFSVRFSKGHMFFPFEEEVFAELRHALLIANKKHIPHIYVWGLGYQYKKLVGALNNKCVVVGAIDKRYQSNSLEGQNVYPPTILQEAEYDYVVITAKNDRNIRETYAGYNLPADKIIGLWSDDTAEYDFIDSEYIRLLKQEEELTKCHARIKNAPYEFGARNNIPITDGKKLLEEILVSGKSLCRYGDGEFEMIRMRKRPWFQAPNKKLSDRLRDILQNPIDNLLIAIADNFGNLDKYTDKAADAIRAYLTDGNTRDEIMDILHNNIQYFDAYVTRPYMMYKDKTWAKQIFGLWRKIWQGRDILLVEGQTSCMGIGNDLLANSVSVRRILCPEKNAFDKYDEILAATLRFAKNDDLILVSLGPTATVLAYDLARKGFQSIDIGQLDNEYDWYRAGASNRQAIEGKTVAETTDGRNPSVNTDKQYRKEILFEIC